MSKLIKCKECNAEISSKAEVCPNCGAKNKKPFYKKIWFWVIIVILIAGIGGASGSSDDTTSTNNQVAENTTKKEETKVNYDNFLKVQMGQTYEEVVAILGEGKESSSSEVNNVSGKMYTWSGKGIANMNVTLVNGVVTGKAQLGLSENKYDITLEKYNQVKEGMSYEEVKAILGEGVITSESKILDITSTMYTYAKKNGSNATFTFSGGKLQAKAQFGLE